MATDGAGLGIEEMGRLGKGGWGRYLAGEVGQGLFREGRGWGKELAEETHG